MRFFTLLFIGLCLILVNTNSGYSIAPQRNINTDETRDIESSGELKTAYTIIIPGKDRGNGWFTPDRIYKIPALPKSQYISNAIYIKTKSSHYTGQKSKGFYSSILQTSLEGLNVENIRQPFEQYAQGELLENDANGLGRIFEIKYDSPVDPYDVCKELMQNPEVEYAVPQFIHQVYEYTPNDPKLAENKQWYINTLKLKDAWEISKGSKDVIIGIVDSAIDWEHEDLAANIWTNPNEIPGNGIDDDENGKIDDIRGWDFIGDVTYAQISSGSFKEDNNPKSNNNNNMHGTHVSGCASAVTNNATGIAGVGFNCTLMPVKVGADNFQVQGIYRGYEGILYAAQNGAKIINCSWGGPGHSPYQEDIINQVTDLGAIIVAASGNDGSNNDYVDHNPSNYEKVLSVGATYTQDRIASFTNYGTVVTVYSPGQSIYSTMPGNSYANQQGTSMASPITAGLAGLLLAKKPNLSPGAIKHQIRSTSDNVLAKNPALRPWYYGRANALSMLTFNDPSYPQNKAPGISIFEYELQGKPSLQDYEKTYINLKLKNYLADAPNLIVKFEAMDNFLTITQETINIGTVRMDEEKELNNSIKLLPNNPWFSGYARIFITFTAGTYTDYQLIKIPININSKNSFRQVYAYPDWYAPTWNSAHATSIDNYWACGQSIYGSGIVFNSKGIIKEVSQSGIYGIYAFDSDNAMAVTGNDNTLVLSTTDGGSNWKSTSVSSISGFFNSIHFFNDNNGIILGDPTGGKFGIGVTSNRGQSWSAINSRPDVIHSEENGWVGSHFWYGDYGWFGTTKGRIGRTTDQGKTWNMFTVANGGHVLRIGFKDANNGIAVYSQTYDPTNPEIHQYMATTTDGGRSWKTGVYDFTQNGIWPSKFWSDEETEQLLMLSRGGEIYTTKDNGSSWKPILSQQDIAISNGDVARSGYDYRFWQSGINKTYLDFKIIPADAKRELTLISDETLVYDSLDIGKSKQEKIEIENTGDVEIEFDEISLLPASGTSADEFTFSFPPPTTLQPQMGTSIRVRFSPEKQGERKAQLKIISDANTGGDIRVNLIGYGVIPTSIGETAKAGGIELGPNSPNPAEYNTTQQLNLNMPAHIKLSLLNYEGLKISDIADRQFSEGEHNLNINLNELSAGIYFLRLQSGSTELIKRIVVTK